LHVVVNGFVNVAVRSSHLAEVPPSDRPRSSRASSEITVEARAPPMISSASGFARSPEERDQALAVRGVRAVPVPERRQQCGLLDVNPPCDDRHPRHDEHSHADPVRSRHRNPDLGQQPSGIARVSQQTVRAIRDHRLVRADLDDGGDSRSVAPSAPPRSARSRSPQRPAISPPTTPGRWPPPLRPPTVTPSPSPPPQSCSESA
jgi:hypothetical protein